MLHSPASDQLAYNTQLLHLLQAHGQPCFAATLGSADNASSFWQTTATKCHAAAPCTTCPADQHAAGVSAAAAILAATPGCRTAGVQATENGLCSKTA